MIVHCYDEELAVAGLLLEFDGTPTIDAVALEALRASLGTAAQRRRRERLKSAGLRVRGGRIRLRRWLRELVAEDRAQQAQLRFVVNGRPLVRSHCPPLAHVLGGARCQRLPQREQDSLFPSQDRESLAALAGEGAAP